MESPNEQEEGKLTGLAHVAGVGGQVMADGVIPCAGDLDAGGSDRVFVERRDAEWTDLTWPA